MARRSQWWLDAYPEAPTPPSGIDLRAARQAAGLSAAALAARMGVGRARVSLIERSAEPAATTVASYRQALEAAARDDAEARATEETTAALVERADA